MWTCLRCGYRITDGVVRVMGLNAAIRMVMAEKQLGPEVP